MSILPAILTALVVLSHLPSFAEESGFSEDSRAVKAKLESLGFKCKFGKPEPSRGTRCKGSISGYPKPLNIYFPAQFKKSSVSLAYHFMGWWTSGAQDPHTKANGDYGAYLSSSKKNAILVLPESGGKNETYQNSFSSPAKLNSFFKSVESLLKSTGASVSAQTPWVISGHSGAYVLMNNMGAWNREIPRIKQLRGVALFDSAYGYGRRPGLTKFHKAMKQSGSSVFFSAYNPNNSEGKRATNKRIQKELGSSPDIKFIADSGTSHMAFMKKYMATFYKKALP